MSNQNTFLRVRLLKRQIKGCALPHATNFSQLTDTYCEVLLVFCLRLDRLTHCEQWRLFTCPSTSPLSLSLALVQAPSLRCTTHLFIVFRTRQTGRDDHRHPQRWPTLSSESLPLWLFSQGNQPLQKNPNSNQSKTKPCHSKPQVSCLKVRRLIHC